MTTPNEEENVEYSSELLDITPDGSLSCSPCMLCPLETRLDALKGLNNIKTYKEEEKKGNEDIETNEDIARKDDTMQMYMTEIKDLQVRVESEKDSQDFTDCPSCKEKYAGL